MRCPSAKRLDAAFKLTKDQIALIRGLAASVDTIDIMGTGDYALRALIERECPKTQAYAKQCHNDPFDGHIWRVTLALHAIDEVMGANGIEGLGPVDMYDGQPYQYVNMGDTYSTTLIYKRDTDALSIGCWGDIVTREDPHGRW